MWHTLVTITHFISDSQLVGRNPKVDHWLVLVAHGPLTGQKIVFREKKSVWPINTLLQYVAVSICIEHGEMQIRHRTRCFFVQRDVGMWGCHNWNSIWKKSHQLVKDKPVGRVLPKVGFRTWGPDKRVLPSSLSKHAVISYLGFKHTSSSLKSIWFLVVGWWWVLELHHCSEWF